MSEPGPETDTVLVQVVPVESGREIGWGSSTVEAFRDRLSDVREAVVSGARAVADSLPGLSVAEGWQLGEVSGSFGICLTAEAGVILTDRLPLRRDAPDQADRRRQQVSGR